MARYHLKACSRTCRTILTFAFVSLLTSIVPYSLAQDEDIEEIVVTGDLNSLPGKNVDSIFGFEKSILHGWRTRGFVFFIKWTYFTGIL